MKTMIIIAWGLLLALIAWQRFTIHELRLASIQETASSNLLPKHHQHHSQAFDAPPSNEATASEHLEHLRKINRLPLPHERARETLAWASSLTSKEALSQAHAALNKSNLTAEELNIFLGRFGPALFFQWGKIAPKDGVKAWNNLTGRTRFLYLGEAGYLFMDKKISGTPIIAPLIQSWAIHHPDQLFQSLNHLHLNLFSDAYLALAQSSPEKMMNLMDQRGQSLFEHLHEGVKTTHLGKSSRVKMIQIIGESLVREYGSAKAAIDHLKNSSESIARTKVLEELLSQNR